MVVGILLCGNCKLALIAGSFTFGLLLLCFLLLFIYLPLSLHPRILIAKLPLVILFWNVHLTNTLWARRSMLRISDYLVELGLDQLRICLPDKLIQVSKHNKKKVKLIIISISFWATCSTMFVCWRRLAATLFLLVSVTTDNWGSKNN